jgi:hypothetical protein
MTKRDFFRLIIKIFGLYSLVLSLFSFIPQNFSNFYFMKDDFWYFFIIISSILLLIALFVILLYKTDFIIDKLKLTKSFDDDHIIIGNLNTESLYKFSIILIGGFMITSSFPNLLMDLINEFKLRISNHQISNHKSDNFWIGVKFLNLLIGYLLVTNCKSISKFLNKN